jgi:hypothetical protein
VLGPLVWQQVRSVHLITNLRILPCSALQCCFTVHAAVWRIMHIAPPCVC